MSDLRDPTLEELYTGPVRALPYEIQQLSEEDTACTFCGVSYFVFAEVQTLQTTVRQYKKTQRDFVRFLERERSVARNLRQQVIEIKRNFADLVMACSTSIKQFSEQNEARCIAKQEAIDQLNKTLLDLKINRQELRIRCQRTEKDQKVHAVIERELRNEISHLSTQSESCTLQLRSQQEMFDEKLDRTQQRLQSLESKFVRWTTTEKKVDVERNELKQKLQTMNERVELESNARQQLKLQLAALREELGRVVAASYSEHESKLKEIQQLKHQIQSFEMMCSELASENGRFKDAKVKHEDNIATLSLAADQLHGKLSESLHKIEKMKDNYTHDLDNVRLHYNDETHRLQQNHAQVVKELITSHNERLESVKQEMAKLESQRVETSSEAILTIRNRHQDAERQAKEWKDRALQHASERKKARRCSAHLKTLNKKLQYRLVKSERDKQILIKGANKQRAELEQRLKRDEQPTHHEENILRQEVEKRQNLLQNEDTVLEHRLDDRQDELESLQAQSTINFPSNQPVIEKTICHDSTNQDCHSNETIIDQLRGIIKQREREITLLQQTVHRECMERTSLLERIRGGKVKVLPETGITTLDRFK